MSRYSTHYAGSVPDKLYNYWPSAWTNPPPFCEKPWEVRVPPDGKCTDVEQYKREVLNDMGSVAPGKPPFTKTLGGKYTLPTNQVPVTYSGFATPLSAQNMVVKPGHVCSPWNDLFYSPPPSGLCGPAPQ